ncbi:MAG: CHAT domain-containing protein [Phormidesmis sp.]
MNLSRRIKFRLICLLLLLLVALLPPAIAQPFQRITQQPALSNPQSASFTQQGRALYETGQFAAALSAWQQAAERFQADGRPLQQAMALSNLSLTYQQLGQWQEAEGAIAAALIQLNAANLSEEYRHVLAQTLDIQGRLQLSQGQAAAAIATWQQAAATYHQLNDDIGATRAQINQAQALRLLGHYRQARVILAETTQHLQSQPDSLLKALGLRSLGSVLRSTGDLESSADILQQSLALSRSLQAPAATAETLLSLGNTARIRGEPATALQFYQEAKLASSDISLQVSAQLHQLSVQLAEQQWAAAQALWPQIVPQLANLPPGRTAIYAHIELAQSLITLFDGGEVSQSQPIAKLLATAVEQSRQLADPRAESYSLGCLGSLYERTQQIPEAAALTEQALLIAQTIEAADLSYQWYWQRGRLLRLQWEQARRQSLASEESPTLYDQAIAAYDQAVKALQSLRYDLVAVHPDVQFSFREQVEPVYREFVDLLLRDRPDEAALQKARETIEALQLAELDNYFREACLAPDIALDAVIDQADQRSAVLYSVILADRIEVILRLPRQPLRHYATSIARAQAETILAELRRSLMEPNRVLEAQALSQQVYEWLIQPAASELAQNQIQTLVFALDGPLQNVPMAALYDGQQYLVERYSTAIAPNLQLVDPQPLEQTQLTTLAAGLSASRHGFSALDYVKSELDIIESEVPSEVLLDQQFTVEALEDEVRSRSFPIIHLATHGQFSSDPSQTFVLAWDRPIQVNELDNFLRTRQTSRADPLELLILSACETAAGDERATLGLAGVAYRAGARSTLASLWSINDESTALLMSQLYQALADRTLTRAEALRQAQLSLLKNPRYQRPMYWAPYVLLGSWL